MLRFEIKKVFSKTKSKAIIAALFVILIVTSILTINRVEYVDENGKHSVGILAAKNLREEKNEWSGYLTEDVLRAVLEENNKINNSKEALSDSIEEQNKAYAKKNKGFPAYSTLLTVRSVNTEITIILRLIVFLMKKLKTYM